MQLTISELIHHLEYAQRELGVQPADLVLLDGQDTAPNIKMTAGGRILIEQTEIATENYIYFGNFKELPL